MTRQQSFIPVLWHGAYLYQRSYGYIYIHKIPHLICMGLKPSSVAPKIVETTFGHGGWWAKWPRGWQLYAVEMSYGQFWPPRWTEITPLSPTGKAGTIYWILMLNLKINGAKPPPVYPPPSVASIPRCYSLDQIVSRCLLLFDNYSGDQN